MEHHRDAQNKGKFSAVITSALSSLTLLPQRHPAKQNFPLETLLSTGSVPLNDRQQTFPLWKPAQNTKVIYFNEQTRALINTIDFFLPGNPELFEVKLNFCAHHSEVIHGESITIRATTNRFIQSPEKFTSDASALYWSPWQHCSVTSSFLFEMHQIEPQYCMLLKRKLMRNQLTFPSYQKELRVMTH